MLHGNDKGDSGSSQLGVGIHGVAGSAVRFASAQLDPTGVPPQLLASGTVCGHANSYGYLRLPEDPKPPIRPAGQLVPTPPGVPSFRRGHMHQHARARIPHSSPARRSPHRMHTLGPAHACSPSLDSFIHLAPPSTGRTRRRARQPAPTAGERTVPSPSFGATSGGWEGNHRGGGAAVWWSPGNMRGRRGGGR